ncbi:hypothetical protein LY90DRAFT_619985 [Neocallimastix californiae]|uniref:Serine protease n=1 Tax=Neocallimastix californiae TaxID=1754190 RepID=A0A1Y2CI36_9FUNG|nr:hypothetical protein LY90DRAFT_619985 [Neocallimastix californiae]|eukprot:ORY46713.1 hypothetical protein LY90DRAFT_619985 [Neocallimastix californiae]
MVFSNLRPFNTLINNINRSICKIEVNKDNRISHGTAFFVQIQIPSKKYPLYGLITNNHVLDEESLTPGKTIDISFHNVNNEIYSILINDEDFVFTSELIDVTFIELNEEMKKEIDPYFLRPSNEDAEINESVIIFQYPQKILSMAHGNITSIQGFNYLHKVSTSQGSSGSPILNSNYEVVGVHKSSLPKGENETYVNMAVKFKILNEYGLELVLSSKEKIKLKKKKISSHEIKIIEKSLFQCDLYGNSLLFYRTNYAWYITILSEYNNVSIYNLEDLQKLDWSPIIPNSNELDDNIISQIKEKEYILITWLKLTELKYL